MRHYALHNDDSNAVDEDHDDKLFQLLTTTYEMSKQIGSNLQIGSRLPLRAE